MGPTPARTLPSPPSVPSARPQVASELRSLIEPRVDRYQEKTGQDWVDRSKFVQQAGKYALLKVCVLVRLAVPLC